jgi:hypothetical protein
MRFDDSATCSNPLQWSRHGASSLLLRHCHRPLEGSWHGASEYLAPYPGCTLACHISAAATDSKQVLHWWLCCRFIFGARANAVISEMTLFSQFIYCCTRRVDLQNLHLTYGCCQGVVRALRGIFHLAYPLAPRPKVCSADASILPTSIRVPSKKEANPVVLASCFQPSLVLASIRAPSKKKEANPTWEGKASYSSKLLMVLTT